MRRTAVTAGGVLTSGGSLGNLTALLAARQEQAGFDAWHQGLRSGPQLCVFVAETAHYSVARSAHILGLGNHGVISVDVDAQLRMRPDALRDAIKKAKDKRLQPIAVVASAGSTAAGAIDPIDAIADICGQERVCPPMHSAVARHSTTPAAGTLASKAQLTSATKTRYRIART